jgi:hypothetical protein
MHRPSDWFMTDARSEHSSRSVVAKDAPLVLEVTASQRPGPAQAKLLPPAARHVAIIGNAMPNLSCTRLRKSSALPLRHMMAAKATSSRNASVTPG